MAVVVNEDGRKTFLRILRERECFPIVNRGQLWYSCLTEEQYAELKQWYQDWLNVTETDVIPTKPEWLKNKLTMEEVIW